jgi:cytochrome c peroxidase
MQRIKLLVIFLFLAAGIFFYGKFLPSSFVNGQTGGNSLTAPTGVTASDGSYSTKVGINWDAARGATVYRIYRNTTNDSAGAVSVGTTAQSVFFDTSAVAGQTFFYWIAAENGTTASALSSPDTGFRANGVIGGQQPLNPPPAPPGNPVTATKAFLGKTLFWDEQLSSTRTVSCGTCHFAANGGSDSRSIVNSIRATNPGADSIFGTADDVFASPGVTDNNADGTFNWSPVYGLREQVTGRKSKSYVDAAYSPILFWDGRATGTFTDPTSGAVVLQNGAALESQVLGPPVNAVEMAHGGRNWLEAAAQISASKPLALSPSVPNGLNSWIGGRAYPQLFEEAFGTPEVTPARIAMAIASFERTLYSDRTPFDAAVSGIAPLTPAEQRGQGVFNNQGRCNTCHAGNLFTDNQFHNIGLRPQTEDTGRFQVTGNQNNLGEFRTPSLRNVELRAPYFHNGRFAALEDVVEFYNRGGDFPAPNVDRNRIRPLNLSPQQKADLVAFLKRPLTDPRVAAQTAPFDRPTLYTESSRVPEILGTGTAGANGFVPQAITNQPPIVGNPNFTVAVSNSLGGAQAVLVIDANDPGTGQIPSNASFARVSVQLSGAGDGQGFGSVSLQIPNNSALVGRTFYGRWFVTDQGAPNNLAVSQAFRFTVFGDTGSSTPGLVSGTVTYGITLENQSAKIVSGALMSVSGASNVSADTNSTGGYLLEDLTIGAQYTVTPSKTGNVNGITAFDATLVLRCVAAGKNCTLTANQRIAGDTNNDETLSAFDATLILRFISAGTAAANTGQVGQWKFLPNQRLYAPLSNPQTNENYEAILVGEVNGSWTPPV